MLVIAMVLMIMKMLQSGKLSVCGRMEEIGPTSTRSELVVIQEAGLGLCQLDSRPDITPSTTLHIGESQHPVAL
jgi:hypothetical protein